VGDAGLGVYFSAPTSTNVIHYVSLTHNYMGINTPDPYFGVTTGRITTNAISIERNAGTNIVDDNYINTSGDNGGFIGGRAVYLGAVGQLGSIDFSRNTLLNS